MNKGEGFQRTAPKYKTETCSPADFLRPSESWAKTFLSVLEETYRSSRRVPGRTLLMYRRFKPRRNQCTTAVLPIHLCSFPLGVDYKRNKLRLLWPCEWQEKPIIRLTYRGKFSLSLEATPQNKCQ